MRVKCPHCQGEREQVKIGFNKSGSQRYWCKVCGSTRQPIEKRGTVRHGESKPCSTVLPKQNSIIPMLSRSRKRSSTSPASGVFIDKSHTYAVEADNAELRHYLARLVRRSRCFSRSIHALWRVVKLFVFDSNRRQRYKTTLPNYPAHVRHFVYP